ncbi:MAG: hypothetical protein KJO43_11865, partial [Phycisphaerae bacterium]|nr:hypothetical protein [Phycisphaerae bacterium]
FAFFLPEYEPAVLGTMPSVYQLLPRPRHGAVRDADGTPIDLLDPREWEKRGWGLADPRQDKVLRKLLPDVTDPAERRRIAVEHQAKCLVRARRFFDALDVPARTPPGLQISLISGDAERTPSVLAVKRTGKPRIVERAPGDGTVTRSSALMDERTPDGWGRELRTPIDWWQVMFLFSDHLTLTKDPAFVDNVLYQLLEAPRVRPGG